MFFFARHLRLNDALFAELTSPKTNVRSHRQFYDVTDYIDAIIASRGITGIQRVQECFVREMLGQPGEAHFVTVDAENGQVWALDRDRLASLVCGTDGADQLSGSGERSCFAEDLLNESTLQALSNNDVLVNVGAFWGGQYGERFEATLFNARCRFGAIIYDIIPIDHPEFCDAQTVALFQEALPRLLHLADGLIAISGYTKRRVSAFASDRNLRIPPVHVVKLGHQLIRPGDEGRISGQPRGLSAIAGPFVLCVGTIEPRKNHLRLVEAWGRLTEEMAQPPTLVIAGKIGWLTPEQLANLRALSAVAGTVVFVHDLSDEQLYWLYGRCLFTVQLSLDEGWGLTVGESLGFGKVCLVASAGALPEVGGDFVEYVDPLDIGAITRSLHLLITRSNYLRALEERIRGNFRPRTWAEFSVDLMAATSSIQANSEQQRSGETGSG